MAKRMMDFKNEGLITVTASTAREVAAGMRDGSDPASNPNRYDFFDAPPADASDEEVLNWFSRCMQTMFLCFKEVGRGKQNGERAATFEKILFL